MQETCLIHVTDIERDMTHTHGRQKGSGVFSFPAVEGLLEGGGMQDLPIRYTPGAKTDAEETLILKLVCVCVCVCVCARARACACCN
jgi:hypothetical protein